MADLSQFEWKSKLENDTNAVVLDVRTASEIAEGMIPDAEHLDIYSGQDFINGLEKLDKNRTYYVYCKSGGRSAQACSIMLQLGFKQAFNLVGGITAWNGEIIVN
jgi:rhodanese-related sulfurtransferase